MGAALLDDTLILESKFIPATDLTCDEESQLTLPGGDTGMGTTPVSLCNWTSNVLAVGDYALAINPIHIGDATISSPERIVASDASCEGDNVAHLNNTASDWTAATDGHFQLFTVAAPTTTSVISQPPEAPVLVGPVGEWDDNSSADIDNGVFTFDDVSPDEGEATWYKVYIQHPDGSRVTVNGDNWFKHLVDPQLTCSATAATATGQKRTCTIDLTENEVTGDLDNSTDQSGLEYTYWIRGYNGDSGGATGPWSAAGTFTHESQDD